MKEMNLQQAIDLINYHKTFLEANDEDYRDEYMRDIFDNNASGSGILLAQAMEIVLQSVSKGANTDGQGKTAA